MSHTIIDVYVLLDREVEEEVGMLVVPSELRCVHTLYVAGSGPDPRLG